jgi:hypothetical protein
MAVIGAAVAIVMNNTPNNPTEFFRKRCTSADAVWFGGALVTDMFTGIFLIIIFGGIQARA